VLSQEMSKNEKLAQDVYILSNQMEHLTEELKDKDARLVKTYNDYMSTYEALLKLRKEKGNEKKQKKPKKEKRKKPEKHSETDIFDSLLSDQASKAPRNSVAQPEMTKHISEVSKPMAFFNMSGGRKSSDSSDAALKELEEENERLRNLLEYKDYELGKKKKEEEFGYDCFSDLRTKFDASLKDMESKNAVLRNRVVEKEDIIEQLQLELREKDMEISKIEDKYR
jgi:hypothetical protein